MSTNIPDDHPRAKSLRIREAMKAAVEDGLVHATGLIAHGRGEAFDYLLGEQTAPEAMAAVQEAAARIHAARQPCLSLNGNAIALDPVGCVRLAEAYPRMAVEINLFHRTPERIQKLTQALVDAGLSTTRILGSEPDTRIPGLESDRGLTCKAGIGEADVVVVPLEDGDRCQALVAMGKTVIAVDLNPLSRTARSATITIVDEWVRVLDHLAQALRHPGVPSIWNNLDGLQSVGQRMAKGLMAPPTP